MKPSQFETVFEIIYLDRGLQDVEKAIWMLDHKSLAIFSNSS
jgi:hypothetical protein